jgi:hypothetical protein
VSSLAPAPDVQRDEPGTAPNPGVVGLGLALDMSGSRQVLVNGLIHGDGVLPGRGL